MASPSVISSTPQCPVTAEEAEDTPQESCSICTLGLEEWEDRRSALIPKELEALKPTTSDRLHDIGKVMPCEHQYHAACIQQWAIIANTCPLCRKSFNQIEIIDPTSNDIDRTIIVQDRIQRVDIDEAAIYQIDQEDAVPCRICDSAENEAELLLCERCDAPYHVACVGLTGVPAGLWFCEDCNARGRLEVYIPMLPPQRMARSRVPYTEATAAFHHIQEMAFREEIVRRRTHAYLRAQRDSSRDSVTSRSNRSSPVGIYHRATSDQSRRIATSRSRSRASQRSGMSTPSSSSYRQLRDASDMRSLSNRTTRPSPGIVHTNPHEDAAWGEFDAVLAGPGPPQSPSSRPTPTRKSRKRKASAEPERSTSPPAAKRRKIPSEAPAASGASRTFKRPSRGFGSRSTPQSSNANG